MAHARKFRFGVQLARRTDGQGLGRRWPARPRTSATRTLFMPDHFGDQLAPVPALMAAADATTTLRVGALVFDNDYKHPVVLAKEIATLDVLSDGRLELGLGAGWMTHATTSSPASPTTRPAVRVDRMEEGIAVIKGLLRRRAVHLRGRALHDHRPRRPAEAGADAHPPILIGGGGKRVLSHRRPRGRHRRHQPHLPQRRRSTPTPPATGRRRRDRPEAARGCEEAAGDRFDDLEINLLTFACIVTDDRDGARREDGAARSASPPAERRGLPPRADRLGRPDLRRPRGPAGALGRLVHRGPTGRHGRDRPGRRRLAGT